MLTWVGGELVAAEDATISVFDRGFRAGEGVFETLRSYGGHPFRLEAHLDRAFRGAQVLGFEPPARADVHAAVRATATANNRLADGVDGALRLTLTPGTIDPHAPWPPPAQAFEPTLVVTWSRLALPAGYHDRGISAVTVPFARDMPEVKAVTYLAASRAKAAARARGADEALLTDAAGHVLEGAASNVFAVVDDTLITPPVAAGLLPGVTRSVVLELAPRLGLPVRESVLPAAAWRGASEAFVTATTREVVPLVAVDGVQVGAGLPGPHTIALLAAYREEVRRERQEAGSASR